MERYVGTITLLILYLCQTSSGTCNDERLTAQHSLHRTGRADSAVLKLLTYFSWCTQPFLVKIVPDYICPDKERAFTFKLARLTCLTSKLKVSTALQLVRKILFTAKVFSDEVLLVTENTRGVSGEVLGVYTQRYTAPTNE